MFRPLVALITFSVLSAACATSPRAVPGTPPEPARRGDTSATHDTSMTRDTSITHDTSTAAAFANLRIDL